MIPAQIYKALQVYLKDNETIICDLHSICNPINNREGYICKGNVSQTSVLNFDKIKTQADVDSGIPSRASVDAVVISPSEDYLCFVELKSWEMFLKHQGKEQRIQKQAIKYETELPQKFSDSINICKQVLKDDSIFNNCKIVYILLTDIDVKNNGLGSIASNLTMLSGTSSNLNWLCNQLSQNIMDNIPNVETRYWECREFDNNLLTL